MTFMIAISFEVLLRIFDPLGISYLYEIHRYFKTMHSPDARFAYISKAGAEGTFQGVTVRINSHGFRGPETTPSKAQGTRRLMLLGDSVVFGWGVDQDRIFPALLQRRIDPTRERLEVVAAGVNSWTTRTEYEFFEDIGINFDPDILVLIISSNDTDANQEGNTAISKHVLFSGKKEKRTLFSNMIEDIVRSAARASYVAAHLKYFAERYYVTRSQDAASETDPRWLDARLALDDLVELCRDRGIEVLIYLYGSEDSIAANPVLALYRRHLTSEGIAALALPDALIRDSSYHNSFVDVHLNERGHQVLTDVILEDLASRVGDPVPRR